MATAKAPQPHPIELGIPGFSYADLFAPARLRALHLRWREGLSPELGARYDAYRADGGASPTPEALSDLLVTLAPEVTRFVTRLFGCEAAWEEQRQKVLDELVVFRFKDEFVKRRATKRTVSDPAQARADGDEALKRL
ncbi:MAG TPA: hypothetical protein VMZ28_11845, partial [Kofleriaceae bacterium]|nr:hypothetical protein [Kofleriaceae bacterium]